MRNGQILRGGGGFGGGDATETYGFGVRVIHSGVWGFASSPLVTPEEIKRVTGIATDVARASAIAKKRDVQLAPVPAYDEFWQVPIEKDPWEVPLEEKVEHAAQRHRDDAEEPVGAVRGRVGELRARMEVPRDERRLVHRAGVPFHQLRRSTRPRAPARR